MKQTLLTLSTCLLLISTGHAQDTPDPTELFRKADSSLRAIQTLSYSAETFMLGTQTYGDRVAVMTPVAGKVVLARLDASDPIGARIRIEGELLANANNRNNISVVYDGYKIRKIDSGKKTFYVNNPDDTGKFLLIGAFPLMPDVLIKSGSLVKELSTSKLRYDGFAVVNNVLCHILYVQSQDTTHSSRSWWFLGEDDYIPRKIIRLYLTPSDGQERGQVITLSNLKINPPLDDSTFELQSPPDYEVKVFQGFNKPKPTMAVGADAPNWTLSDADGKQHSLSDFRGKIVILDFWATWCAPCLEAMPKLQQIHEQFSDDVEVIGISTWDRGDPAKMMRQRKFTYRLLLEGDEVAEKYGVNGLPTLYVIGKNGKIMYGVVGLHAGMQREVTRIIQSGIKDK